jgi:hypothetical protein
VLASGNTAFAYSNEYIAGYSSLLSDWDTVRYQGNVIDPMGVSIRKGFGCGDKLAYFATDADIFYVFDAELAEWKEYYYGPVLSGSGNNNFWAADVYAGAILERTGYLLAKNIAYSLITHSFAEVDQGGWYYYADNKMNGGYVANWGDGTTQAKYFGYSAVTNQFSEVTFPAGFNVNLFATPLGNTSIERTEDRYIFTCGYSVGDQFQRDVYLESYSTKTGNWYSYQYQYDPNDLTGTSWKGGGSFSLGKYRDKNTQSIGLWKFYGNSGTYIGEISGLYGATSTFVCGGNLAVMSGEHNLWFHDFETGNTKNRFYPPNDQVYYTQHFAEEDYCSVFRVNNENDTMRVFFFNSNTNRLQSFLVHKYPTSVQIANSKLYGYVTGGPENEVILYSAEKDSVLIYNAPQSISGSMTVKNILAGLTISMETSIVFDASTAQIFENNFAFLSTGTIGDYVVFVKTGDSEITAYSAITKNWTTKQTDQLLYGSTCGDKIGLAFSQSFSKCWGYSAYDDNFYEFTPEGSMVAPFWVLGGETAIVLRTTNIYAFNPRTMVAVEDQPDLIAQRFYLSPNYPNPFNPTTKIKFTIPSVETAHPATAGQVSPSLSCKLVVYDPLGRKVATLIDEERPPGEYEIEFNGKGLPSGVYFYRLEAAGYLKTKKMMLLK